jgi:predicted Rossmann-fold nucleotide-binding protein
MMEATNFGAYLAEESEVDFLAALDCLKKAPHFESPGYMECAREVVKRHPGGCESLAIPTWFYGHEPSNLFSRHVAKYFSNSIREDGLLAIARHGVIYSPGSAGTVQEVFMDATQNHYATFDYVSPMAFLGRDHYGDRTGIFDVVKRQAAGKGYSDLIELFEDPSDLIKFICSYTLTKPEPSAP